MLKIIYTLENKEEIKMNKETKYLAYNTTYFLNNLNNHFHFFSTCLLRTYLKRIPLKINVYLPYS